MQQLSGQIGAELVSEILAAHQTSEEGITAQRVNVARLKMRLEGNESPEALDLLALAEMMVKKSVWLVGGDGWAYDIGAGGLDHVLGSGMNVNVLVLDTEVYSNTGGQMSKATPRGAVAKFAMGGKQTAKKDLAMEALSYGNVYVARVAMGGNDTHTVKAFQEAEAHDGPSLIIAYSHCIAHGYDMAHGLEQQKAAVLSGYWPLFRYNPNLIEKGFNPFQLDSKAPSIPLKQYAYQEARYTMLVRSDPTAAAELLVTGAGGCEPALADLCRSRGSFGRARGSFEGERTSGGEGARGKWRLAMIDLTTGYMGLQLRNPLVASASPLTESAEHVRRMEDAGIAAVVLPSFFQEQLDVESAGLDRDLERGGDAFYEALGYLPDLSNYNTGPEGYLERIVRIKRAVRIPVIASLNVDYAERLDQLCAADGAGGGDAIELNIYALETDPLRLSDQVEADYISLVRQVKLNVRIPVAVKLTPFFSALMHMATCLTKAGADGLVLFNRF